MHFMEFHRCANLKEAAINAIKSALWIAELKPVRFTHSKERQHSACLTESLAVSRTLPPYIFY